MAGSATREAGPEPAGGEARRTERCTANLGQVEEDQSDEKEDELLAAGGGLTVWWWCVGDLEVTRVAQQPLAPSSSYLASLPWQPQYRLSHLKFIADIRFKPRHSATRAMSSP